ncbi:hypothetical protein EVAR_8857_1 [Eumeta japonica]|uniref:Uncharacterized protein n=1 Tax=Eumeta variegata TaxID=151549 RepID=A0A4C1TU36_EUMVA|nr:hypothetical protein EVAR_8857_1 [Eumeta japonica]
MPAKQKSVHKFVGNCIILLASAGGGGGAFVRQMGSRNKGPIADEYGPIPITVLIWPLRTDNGPLIMLVVISWEPGRHRSTIACYDNNHRPRPAPHRGFASNQYPKCFDSSYQIQFYKVNYAPVPSGADPRRRGALLGSILLTWWVRLLSWS